MPDRRLVEQAAADLGTDPGLVEKDWHVVRALSVIATLGDTGITPVFSGGTSLSKGWELIRRFSEDIDFKVAMPAASPAKARSARSAYRRRLLDALVANGFTTEGEPLVGNASQFFRADLAYPSAFATGRGLRPHVRIEMTFHPPRLPPAMRPIRSLISMLDRSRPAEIEGFPCVDPVETAADKLSALAWRVCARDHAADGDDPTVIRHLHDLAALEAHAGAPADFRQLVRDVGEADGGRGGDGVPTALSARLALMLSRLGTDALWRAEYESFVRQVSFADAEDMIGYDRALAACTRLVAIVDG